jgi:hypothetical protein
MSTTMNHRAGVGASRRKFNKLVSNPVFEDCSLRKPSFNSNNAFCAPSNTMNELLFYDCDGIVPGLTSIRRLREVAVSVQ